METAGDIHYAGCSQIALERIGFEFMFASHSFVFGISLTALMPLACLWDYDTLLMERSAVPSAHEAIVGYFARHSDDYYKWRIEDRGSISIDQRSPSDYDDIAVAQEKLGRHDDAIQTIQEKIERWPKKGRYESEANLATFLIHSGRYAEGLTHIDQALEINPNAHFGREIYQKRLVEYLIDSKAKAGLEASETTRMRFDAYLYRVRNEQAVPTEQPKIIGKAEPAEEADEYDAAIEGLIGMLRFGNHDSPILLAALGDLLSSNMPPDARSSANANRLAARAYLVASYSCSEPTQSEYRQLAEEALLMQADETLPQIEDELKRELQQADSLQVRIANDERNWVAKGLDLDEMFAATYGILPPLEIQPHNQSRSFGPWLVLISGVPVVAALAFVWKRRKTRLGPTDLEVRRT